MYLIDAGRERIDLMVPERREEVRLSSPSESDSSLESMYLNQQ
jgi:hypothetical protein